MKHAICLFVTIGVATSSLADVVLDWNNVLLDSHRATAASPPRATRAMAMVHAAMYDAINGVLGGYEPYLVTERPLGKASPDAAGAAAAHRVLSALYPSRQGLFDAALADSLADIPAGLAQKGVAFGELCADAVLAARANDGADLVLQFDPLPGPGMWMPTPPGFLAALLPSWPLVAPFCMTSGDMLRSAGPPALDSDWYAAAFIEVKELGRASSATRTPDETEIAYFWADGAGTSTPAGHWLSIAQDLSAQEGLTLIENARLFALLGMTACDASIACWDNKYHFNHWRPVTAIHNADIDGNPATEADPTWTPLITTPPFPSYTSGHSTFSSACATILAEFFGRDEMAFSATSEGLPGVWRNFASLSGAADEAGRSRVYGGIHFEYDNLDAAATGQALGRWVFANFLKSTHNHRRHGVRPAPGFADAHRANDAAAE